MVQIEAQYARPFDVPHQTEFEAAAGSGRGIDESVIKTMKTGIYNANHMQPREAGTYSCARACFAAWSPVSVAVTMLRTDLVTIQGDPGSSG